MGTRVKVSSKNQIAVPAEARRKLNIKSGDTLLIDVIGNQLLVMREPDDWVKYLRGLHKDVWEGIDAQEYVNHERAAWTD